MTTKSPIGTKGVPREDREAQILEIAVEVLGTRGYSHATLADIAQRAGVSKPMIYLYFESKDGLYLACLHRAGQSIVDAVNAAQQGSSPARALATIAAIFATLEGRRHDWSVLWDQTLPQGSIVHDAAQHYRNQLIDLGATGTSEVLVAAGNTNDLDTDMLTAIWLNVVTTVVQWWLAHPDEDAGAMTKRCSRLLDNLTRPRVHLR